MVRKNHRGTDRPSDRCTQGHFGKNIGRYRDLCDADADSRICRRQLMPAAARDCNEMIEIDSDLIDPK